MNEILVEVAQFLLAQYEGGSGQVAEQAALLQKKLKGEPAGTTGTTGTAAPAEVESEPAPDHQSDEPLDHPLRAHTGRKQSRKGHS